MPLTIANVFRSLGLHGHPVIKGPGGASPPSYPTDTTIVTHSDSIPNFAKNATIKSIVDGDWSNTTTWDLGRIPTTDDIVGIQQNTTVTYDISSTSVIKAVGVAGTLKFRNDINTKLVVQHLLVYGPVTLGDGVYGRLETGTIFAPISSSVTLDIIYPDVAIDTGNATTFGADPAQYGNGMLCWGEHVSCGASKTVYARAFAEPIAGHTNFTFQSSLTNWLAGDEMVVPDCRQLNSGGGENFSGYSAKWENRTISSMTSGNTVANFSSALSYNHPGGENGYTTQGTGASDFYPHIANLSRNIKFSSANPTGVRGHTMYLDRAKVDVRYTRFNQLGRTGNGDLSSFCNTGSNVFLVSNTSPIIVTTAGPHEIAHGDTVKISSATGNTAANGTWTVTYIDNQNYSLNGSTGNGSYTGGAVVRHIGTNQKGRYAVHVHHVDGPETIPANGYQLTWIGNVVDDPLPATPSNGLPASKWGITVHASHYGLYQDNIVHHYAGSGFMTEDGSESFNVFDGNYSLSNIGNRNPRDLDKLPGTSGAGFFFVGFNHYIRNNIAAGNIGTFTGIVSGSGYELFVNSASVADVRNPLFKGADVNDGILNTDYVLVNPQLQPILEFDNNEACGGAGGLVLWEVGTNGYSTPDGISESIISDFKVWHVYEFAIFGYPTVNVTYDGFTVRGDPARLNSNSPLVAFTYGDYWAGGTTTLRNYDIRGVYQGIGNLSNVHGTVDIEDGYILASSIAMFVITPTTFGTASSQGDQVYNIDNFRSAQWGSDPGYYDLAMAYDVSHGNSNLRVLQEVNVTNYQGVSGDDFRLYYNEQARSYVMLASSELPMGSTGCPEVGLTNAQAYVKYHSDGTLKSPTGSLSDLEGCAVAGACAPASPTTRSGIYGLLDES